MDRQEVLERTTEKNGSAPVENREISVQEQLHRDKMPEYRKALYSDDFVTDTLIAEKPTAAPAVQTAPKNTQKVAEYTPYAPSKQVYFEDVITKDIETVAPKVQPAPAAVSAPVIMPAAPAYAPAPAAPEVAVAPSEEDALPTRRTMNTLRHATVEAETQAQAGFFASLSTRTKVVLAAIATAIVLAIVLICINTGIINAKDAKIESLRKQVLQKQ